jgi:beta-fructofuranosidase
MKIPYIAGNWKMLFEPKECGNYINDHCFFKALDGKYHIFGITSFQGATVSGEKYFAHGVTDSLDVPMKEEKPAIDRGTLAWAPCVTEKDGNYYMIYGPSPTQLAVSFDLYEWYNYPIILKNEPLFAAHRDHFVLKVEDVYLMYVVGTKDRQGVVTLFESKNLLEWDFAGYALTSGPDAPLQCAWGPMESPHVVKVDNMYYMLLTYTDCSSENYHNTLVFASENPRCFGEYNGEKGGAIPVTKLYAHAPEILKDGDDYYITTCGWKGYELPINGGVSIAPLKWKEN